MPRRPRLVLPGVPHHITQRGNNRRPVFLSDEDRVRYLHLLLDSSRRYELRVLAWCLMTNHIHLIAIPKTIHTLALTLRQTHSQYSLELNQAQGWVGHIWQNRFYSSPLASSHLLTAIRYVELNPVRARMIDCAWGWPWSSAQIHTVPSLSHPLVDWPWQPWIEEARLGRWDHVDWKNRLSSAQPPDELDRLRRATRLGEPLGSDEFISHLEAQAGRPLRIKKQGRPRKKAEEAPSRLAVFAS